MKNYALHLLVIYHIYPGLACALSVSCVIYLVVLCSAAAATFNKFSQPVVESNNHGSAIVTLSILMAAMIAAVIVISLVLARVVRTLRDHQYLRMQLLGMCLHADRWWQILTNGSNLNDQS
jgi:hypothetical protein